MNYTLSDSKLIKELKLQHLKDQQTIEILQQNHQLLQQNHQLLQQQLHEANKIIKELQKALTYYDNSNTPPSINTLSRQGRKAKKQQENGEHKQQQRQNDSTAKKGPRYGHVGHTQKFKPTSVKTHVLQRS